MTAPFTSQETARQREQRLFRELFARLIDTILNVMFDLRPEKAARRAMYFTVLFLFSGFLISMVYYPLSLWTSRIGNIFASILSTNSSPELFIAEFSEFVAFFWDVFTDPRILQYLPVFLAPFFIALQSAAIYLADVFELEDVAVARHFVRAVALTGSDETIRIKHGEIAEEHLNSPAYLIGGPGKAMVELDSVALFERADGTPHVIGPTGNKPGGRESLEGFERLRQAIDIRDHYINLRDQDERSKAVYSRSLDGIPIKATDVRLMFSIFRGHNPAPSAELPYPFDEEAIKQIVYKADSRVTPEQINPSTFDFSWTNKMIGLIRGRLGRFMSERNLTEYLASIGLPEIEKVKQREDKIFQQMQELTQSGDDSADQKNIKPPPDFQSRYKIKNLFAQFAEGFSSQTRNSGVELQWIGVGTWESPVDIVPEKHFEAWLLTQENLKKDSQEAMNKIERDEIIEKMKELIQKVPIDTYVGLVNTTKYNKRSWKPAPRKKDSPKLESGEEDVYILPEDDMAQVAKRMLVMWNSMQEENTENDEIETDHDNNLKTLLLEYRKLFMETIDFIKAKNEPVPQNLLDAVRHIENQIGHWAGRQ